MAVIDFHLLVRHQDAYLLCNAATHYSNPIDPKRAPTHRGATERDMTLAIDAATTEILDSIAAQYSPQEFESVAKTLGYTNKELAAYRQSEADGRITAYEARCLTDILAYKVTGMFRNHAAVSTPAILQAGDEELNEFRDWYVSEARRLIDEMSELEKEIEVGKTTVMFEGEQITVNQFADHPGWAVRRSQLERVCELLWQVETRLGLML